MYIVRYGISMHEQIVPTCVVYEERVIAVVDCACNLDKCGSYLEVQNLHALLKKACPQYSTTSLVQCFT